MSFILKGVQHPKINNKELVDGLFQIDIPGRTFHFVTKCQVVHSIGFGELYDARGSPDNRFVLTMLFNNSYPCELHAQNEAEREAVDRILRDIIRKLNIDLNEKLRNNSIQKQIWVKKKGKVIPTKRLLHLCNPRHTLIVFKDDNEGTLPSYHILLHNRVTILPRKNKGIQIISTYKNLQLSFGSKEIRNEWLDALNGAKEPLPTFDPAKTAPSFEPVVNFLPDTSVKRYPQPPHTTLARAGPSAD